tara:strand:+ start:117 stop:614 length:498 start_codon:yes stop_codon:yes gene_type:complete
MIISCEQCNKKFEVESDLIPDTGRLLQCSACDNKWFFKKTTTPSEHTDIIINKDAIDEEINTEVKKIQPTEQIENTSKSKQKKLIEKKKDKSEKFKSHNNNKNLKAKKNNFLNLILVFIITFIAFILILDTFKKPIGLIIPNVDFFLNNFYETIKDIILFFKDLV